MIYIKIVQGLLLLWAGIEDIRSRSVSLGLLIAMGVVSLVGLWIGKGAETGSLLGGLCVGICFLVLSYVTKEQIGRGDGMAIAAIGIQTGVSKCLIMVCAASLLMAVLSMALLLCKKADRQTRLPFLPALFAGYLIAGLRCY